MQPEQLTGNVLPLPVDVTELAVLPDPVLLLHPFLPTRKQNPPPALRTALLGRVSAVKDGHRSAQADRTLRPLRLRAASTRRPFLVAMRWRKPCTLLRWRFLG